MQLCVFVGRRKPLVCCGPNVGLVFQCYILSMLVGMLYAAASSDFFSLHLDVLIIASLIENSQVLLFYGSHSVSKGSGEVNGDAARWADGCSDEESWEKAFDGKR